MSERKESSALMNTMCWHTAGSSETITELQKLHRTATVQCFRERMKAKVLTERCWSWLRWISPPSESIPIGAVTSLEGTPRGPTGEVLQEEKPTRQRSSISDQSQDDTAASYGDACVSSTMSIELSTVNATVHITDPSPIPRLLFLNPTSPKLKPSYLINGADPVRRS